MSDSRSPAGLPRHRPSTWFVWLLAATFVGLGLIFLAAPRAGALIFGLPPPDGASLGYLPAIGLRDLAFGLYLLILSLVATRHALALVLAATLLIPVGDCILVAVARGLQAPGHLLLHGTSAVVLGATAAWLSWPPSRTPRED